MTIAEVRLHNFKAFERFICTFGSSAYLVGANNAGKSTLLSAIRAASRMIRYASTVAPITTKQHKGRNVIAYSFSANRFDLVEENIRYEFRGAEAQFEVRFKNQAKVTAVWPELDAGGAAEHVRDGDDYDEEADGERNEAFFYLTLPNGGQTFKPAEIRRGFPAVGVIPVLTPVEHDERILTDSTVKANFDTRLASRHFRNQLRLLQAEEPDDDVSQTRFHDFAAFADEWTPELQLRELVDRRSENTWELDLFYTEPERRADKEIFWAGDGMQVWIQLLLHIYRLRNATTIVLDEPDLYLHADLQRRLVRCLESTNSQTITATHSSEMMAEAPAEAVVWVDKTARRAIRGPKGALLSDVARVLGSNFNLRLARALRSKVVLFVEGQDMRLLRTLAKKVDATRVADEKGVAVVPMEGYSNWTQLDHFAWLMGNLLEEAVQTFVILDRDYRSTAAIERAEQKLRDLGINGHVWRRKELENYLLDSDVVARAAKLPPAEVKSLLADVVDSFEDEVFGRLLGERAREEVGARAHLATVTEAFRADFRVMWTSTEAKLAMCPAKDVLRRLNTRLDAAGGRTVSARALAAGMKGDEVPSEMRDLLLRVEDALLS